MRSYNIAQRLAITAGIAASGGALWILCSDAITSGHWTNEEILMPVVVGITIAAGHLSASALRMWRPLAALGFAALFLLGTGLTIFNSVGRQATKSDTSALEVKVHNDLIREKQTELDSTKQRLNDAEKNADRERGTKCGTRCKDWEARAKDLRRIVTVLESEIAALGAPKPVNAKASRFAEVASIIIDTDRSKIEHVVATIEPFLWSLFLELTAIVGFGFGFAHAKSDKSSARVRENEFGKSRGPETPRPRRGRKADPKVVDFTNAFRARHGRGPTYSELRGEFPAMPKATASDYARRARA